MKRGAIFAATDSYRLSECRLTLGGDAQGETISIVPSRSMQEISRIISGYKDDIQGSLEVSLSFTDNQLVMSYGSVELVTRLLEGKFLHIRTSSQRHSTHKRCCRAMSS